MSGIAHSGIDHSGIAHLLFSTMEQRGGVYEVTCEPVEHKRVRREVVRVLAKASKTYSANGEREKTRRLKQMEPNK